jgi:hypothetical protein
MKTQLMRSLLGIALAMSLVSPMVARAEDDGLAKEEASAESTKDRPEWKNVLKTQYKLTDEQIKSMQDKGLSYPNMAMAAALAEKSGKTLDAVLKMRVDDKMGWGKIAKELGVPPKEIGQSVANARHEIKEDRQAEKEEKRNAKRDERLERQEAKRTEKNEHRKK